MSLAKIGSALKAAGRQRNIESHAAEIQTALRREHLAAPPAVAAAFGATTTAAVHVITALNDQIADLESALADHFETHPDADIYRSLPGLGVVPAPGEFGDDPKRFTTAKCRKNYAGTSPLTIASGRKRAVLARHVRNKRLYDAFDQWAFCTLTRSPGARTYYDEHRAAGDTHPKRYVRSGTAWWASFTAASPPHPLRRRHSLGAPTSRSCLTHYTPGYLDPDSAEGAASLGAG